MQNNLSKHPSLIALFFLLLIVGCKPKQAGFISVPAAESNIHFVNKVENRPYFNILYYLYFYNGGGVSVGDINNDGLTDIFFVANYKGGNKLYLNKGNFKFEDITAKAGVAGLSDWSTGSAMADVNADGLLDIYVSTVSNRYGLKGHNELYINKGNEQFIESSADYGLNTSCLTTQSAFFDFDNDGDLDLFMLNQSHEPNQFVRDTSLRSVYDSLSGDRLYRNDVATTGKFTDVSKEAGIIQSTLGYGLGIATGDINNDGFTDIYIGNDFHENDYYYINQRNGSFKESGAQHFRHYSRFSMGNDLADYNNDGLLDVVTVDMLPPDEKTLKTYGSDENLDIYYLKLLRNGYQYQYSRNVLQRNNFNGESFSDIALLSGMSATDWSWSALFSDFDNDGIKDLFISSGIVKRPVDLDYIKFASDLKMRGMDRTNKFDDTAINAMPGGESHPYFFKGDGQYSFKDVSEDWGTGKMKGFYNGAAYADFDNDGRQDMVINALNSEAVLLRNNCPSKNYLSFSFTGNTANKNGVGARVYLFQKGKLQYQQLMLTRGFQSSVEPRLHFGLETLSVVDSALVVWPGNQYQLLRNLKANQFVKVRQQDATGSFNFRDWFPGTQPPFELDTSFSKTFDWRHRENAFLDFNRQYLIPHQQSTRGPKIAVADVNGDGLDDVYLCGAKGQPGALKIQQADGSFVATDTTLFNHFAISEDVDAKFFDANGDGFPDLWVVSGGNEMPANEVAAKDRLYINDGKGNFSIRLADIPKLDENKSCVTTADYDHDGDLDVFVGFLSDPNKYGIPQNSYLYKNEGNGKFIVAPQEDLKTIGMGMVTAASFADFNNDGWADLAVSGEFMPVKIFMNNKGKFNEGDIPSSTGLWQTMHITDVNGDGFMDILAGNWGFNSKLWAGKDGPLKLYTKDFDNNASIESILAYTIKGKEYTFLAKDELEKQLPVLRKGYLTYSEVAGQTVQYMFDDLFKNYTELKAETLATTCFLNDGKGNFSAIVLPLEFQLSPVFSFVQTGDGEWLAGGNFYGVIPYEGRYDAMNPTILKYDKAQHKFITGPAMNLAGEVRDLKWLNTKEGRKLVVARNNEALLFLNPSSQYKR